MNTTTMTVTGVLPLQHLVGGTWIDGSTNGAASVSKNPARPGIAVATYQAATERDLHAALSAASQAQETWSAAGPIARGRVLRRAAEILEQRVEQIAQLVTAEEGKTLPESRVEVQGSVEMLHYHSSRARSADGATFASSHPDELIRTLRRPLGVVGVITPWNFPVQIPVWKIAPALLWGNSVIWKPASETPAVSVALASVFVDAGVPPGVLNVLLGPGQLGACLVAAEQVAAITFTGSVPVGREIAAVAVSRGAKVQLELGGHNAAVVLADVDPAAVAAAVVAGAMGMTGQKCTATRRIIAVGAAYADLVPELQSRIATLRVGDGADDGVDIGPLVSEQSRAKVESAVVAALREGAELLARSPGALDGCFYAPTLLAGGPQLSITRDEVFGPVVTLMAARDLDHAIELANATRFGLTASVFTSDERTVRRCVNEIQAGLVKANAPTTGSELHVPFGGLKDSSFPAPREQNGDSSAEFFTWTKSAYLRTAQHWSRP